MSRLKGISVIEVIEVVVLEGEGVPGDPTRNVTYYYDRNGTVLAKCDHWDKERGWKDE